ncbi:MAG: cyclic nucleotide-binding domain-containing protein [Acidimicrobiia bacterium]
MRYESTVTSLGWIPSEAIEGMVRLPIDMGVGHYDPPPPDHIDRDVLAQLVENDAIRFANRLSAWIDVEDGDIVDAGYSGTGIVGSTTAHLGPLKITFPGVAYPVLQQPPVVANGRARFTQTAGGRTGAPLPRRIDRPPFLRISGPTAWSTLTLDIAATGTPVFELSGSSPFPRQWVYDGNGDLALKTATTDWKTWTRIHDHARSPWHGVEHVPLVAEVASPVEREFSKDLMRSKPKFRKVAAGETITVQNEPGDELYLVIDGVFDVDVDGETVAEVGPGAIVGERSILEGGVRSATVRARTAARVAVQRAVTADPVTLAAIAADHRREER